jgi:hypothetical protein
MNLNGLCVEHLRRPLLALSDLGYTASHQDLAFKTRKNPDENVFCPLSSSGSGSWRLCVSVVRSKSADVGEHPRGVPALQPHEPSQRSWQTLNGRAVKALPAPHLRFEANPRQPTAPRGAREMHQIGVVMRILRAGSCIQSLAEVDLPAADIRSFTYRSSLSHPQRFF